MERTQATAQDDAMFPMRKVHETCSGGFELQWQRCKGIHTERSTECAQLTATGAKQDMAACPVHFLAFEHAVEDP